MRRFMVHLLTEIDFVEGDKVSDDKVQGYKKHLAETVHSAAQGLSLRTKRHPCRGCAGRRNQGLSRSSRRPQVAGETAA